jgi:pyridoxine 4-dehydrogenase
MDDVNTAPSENGPRLVARRGLGPFAVAPIGFGAMRLTGPNVFGPPRDRRGAIRVLREAVARGVDHIDTAQFYGPNLVNELIREALHPYPLDLVLVSKVGARRDGRGGVFADDEPQQLRLAIEENLQTLDIEALPVVNLRLMRGGEPNAFFDDQLGAMVAARDDGLIKSIGLSNISLAHLLRALPVTPVACVQNLFHVANRASQPVLDECTRRGIAFVPFGSLGFGGTGPDAVLRRPEVVEQAARLSVTPAQLVLAWTLALAPNTLLIPGASSVDHLRENLDASEVQLDPRALDGLSAM